MQLPQQKSSAPVGGDSECLWIRGAGFRGVGSRAGMIELAAALGSSTVRLSLRGGGTAWAHRLLMLFRLLWLIVMGIWCLLG